MNEIFILSVGALAGWAFGVAHGATGRMTWYSMAFFIILTCGLLVGGATYSG